MKIEYQIKGVTLDVFDLIKIKQYANAAFTAECVMDNYPEIVTDEKMAMDIGYEVRRLMDKYGYDEEDAIVMAMREYNATEE